MTTVAPIIEQKYVKQGVSLAKQGINLRWEWGDLALSVAPLSEGLGVGNGRNEALNDLLERISAKGEISLSDLPTAASLVHYRDGCAVIPPGEYRKGVTIYFARELGQLEKDPAKRLVVIDTLRAEHSRGKATIDGLRAMYGKATTRTAGKADKRIKSEIENLSVEDRAALVASVMDPEMAKAMQETKEGQQASEAVSEANDERWHEKQRERWQNKVRNTKGEEVLNAILTNNKTILSERERREGRDDVNKPMNKASMALSRIKEAHALGIIAIMFDAEEIFELANGCDQLGDGFHEVADELRNVDPVPDEPPADWT